MAQLLCSVHLHVLRQALEACSLRLCSQRLQQLLCMCICVLAVAAYILQHHQISMGQSKAHVHIVVAVAAYVLHHQGSLVRQSKPWSLVLVLMQQLSRQGMALRHSHWSDRCPLTDGNF